MSPYTTCATPTNNVLVVFGSCMSCESNISQLDRCLLSLRVFQKALGSIICKYELGAIVYASYALFTRYQKRFGGFKAFLINASPEEI